MKQIPPLGFRDALARCRTSASLNPTFHALYTNTRPQHHLSALILRSPVLTPALGIGDRPGSQQTDDV